MQYQILQDVVLRNIGGLRINEFTRCVMSYVMVNNSAMQYNLFGRNRKRAFTQSCSFDIFYSKFYIQYYIVVVCDTPVLLPQYAYRA